MEGACGRTQRVHVHEPMAYAKACMDCAPGPTGVGTCPQGRFSRISGSATLYGMCARGIPTLPDSSPFESLVTAVGHAAQATTLASRLSANVSGA